MAAWVTGAARVNQDSRATLTQATLAPAASSRAAVADITVIFRISPPVGRSLGHASRGYREQ